MKPKFVTAVLVSLLVVGAAVLGLTLSGSGVLSERSDGGYANQDTTVSGKAPGVRSTLVVRAQAVGQQFLYLAGTLGQILPDMFVPLEGLPVTVAREVPPEAPTRDRPRPLSFETNASGVAEFTEPAGNYSVLIVGQGFALNTTLALRVNVTATLDMKLIPSFASVNNLKVVGRDSSSALEPTATIYVDVGSGVEAAASGFSQLIGQVATNSFAVAIQPAGAFAWVSGYANVNATATGRYDSPGGSWVVLAPLGAYQTYPNANVFLVQFTPTYTVSYGAD